MQTFGCYSDDRKETYEESQFPYSLYYILYPFIRIDILWESGVWFHTETSYRILTILIKILLVAHLWSAAICFKLINCEKWFLFTFSIKACKRQYVSSMYGNAEDISLWTHIVLSNDGVERMGIISLPCNLSRLEI